MTPDDLNDALDAMAAAAGDDPSKQPGLITAQSDHWINVLGVIGAKAATLADGLRYRNIKIEIAFANATTVLTRAQAGDRGAPYREISARA